MVLLEALSALFIVYHTGIHIKHSVQAVNIKFVAHVRIFRTICSGALTFYSQNNLLNGWKFSILIWESALVTKGWLYRIFPCLSDSIVFKWLTDTIIFFLRALKWLWRMYFLNLVLCWWVSNMIEGFFFLTKWDETPRIKSKITSVFGTCQLQKDCRTFFVRQSRLDKAQI